MTLHASRHGATLVLSVDRPETKNAIDAALVAALVEQAEAARGDPSVRAIVLTSTGDDVFLAGGDLKAFSSLDMHRSGAVAVAALGERLQVLEQLDVPVIAAIHGAVLGGGCELVLLCDLLVIERQASLRFVHARMGLSPAWGGTARLLARVGAGRARRALLLAERIDAETAERWGLVDRVVDTGEALAVSLALAERVAALPAGGVAAVKRSLYAADAAGERDAFLSAWGGEDHRAAMRAFAARRQGGSG